MVIWQAKPGNPGNLSEADCVCVESGFKASCLDCSGKDFRCKVLVFDPRVHQLETKHRDNLLREMHGKRKLSDVMIRCGTGNECIEANSCVLAVSPVFESMLKSPLKEGCTHVIQIDDCSLDAMKAFVELLYTGRCSAEADWGELLILADKYQVADLIPICTTMMRHHLSAGNVASCFRALNKLSHVEACKQAKDVLFDQVYKQKHLMRAMVDDI